MYKRLFFGSGFASQACSWNCAVRKDLRICKGSLGSVLWHDSGIVVSSRGYDPVTSRLRGVLRELKAVTDLEGDAEDIMFCDTYGNLPLVLAN